MWGILCVNPLYCEDLITTIITRSKIAPLYPHVTPVLNFTSFHWKTKDYTIIQLLFPTTLFRELPEINSVAATNFRDQSLFATVNYTYMARTCSHRKTFSTTRPSLTSVRVFARESWFTIYILIELKKCIFSNDEYKKGITSICVFHRIVSSDLNPRLQSREKTYIKHFYPLLSKILHVIPQRWRLDIQKAILEATNLIVTICSEQID